MHKNVYCHLITRTNVYRSDRDFWLKNNKTGGDLQIQSIFFRVGTTFRVGARLCRLGHRFGLHAHPHTGKQLSSVAGFAGVRRSNDNDDDDDDEGAHGLTSPTVADVRRRARQSTCHATPGSFELIARGLFSLSPPFRRIPSSPCPPISSHSGLLVRFFSFLHLLFTPPSPRPRVTRSLPYSLLAGSILASSSRLEWDPSRCKRNGADAPGIFQPWVVPLKFCIAWEWLVGSDGKRSDVTRIFPSPSLNEGIVFSPAVFFI